jgi:ATP-dependent Lon protease
MRRIKRRRHHKDAAWCESVANWSGKGPGSTETVLPVLPLRDIVVFPHMIVPLFVGREKSIRALEEVMRSDKQILLATQINAGDDDPDPRRHLPDRHHRQRAAAAQAARRHRQGAGRGPRRAPNRQLHRPRPTIMKPSHAVELAEPDEDAVEIEALSRSVVSEFEKYVKLNKKISPEVVGSQPDRRLLQARRHDRRHLAIKIADKQDMLEIHRSVKRVWSRCSADGGRDLGAAGRKSASAAASSARWRRPSASTTSTSR